MYIYCTCIPNVEDELNSFLAFPRIVGRLILTDERELKRHACFDIPAYLHRTHAVPLF